MTALKVRRMIISNTPPLPLFAAWSVKFQKFARPSLSDCSSVLKKNY